MIELKPEHLDQTYKGRVAIYDWAYRDLLWVLTSYLLHLETAPPELIDYDKIAKIELLLSIDLTRQAKYLPLQDCVS